MDWTSILTALIAALIPTGGVIALVTMTEKKSALMLENAKSLADSYKALAEEYKSREADTTKRLQEREIYLQGIAKERGDELMAQVKMNSSLRHSLDDAHTEVAVCKIMYCKDSQCPKRNPPFGSDAQNIVSRTKEQARKAYTRDEGIEG